MPQLDTIYTFMIYLWTWMTLNLIMKTIKKVPMNKTPKIQHKHTNNYKTTLPWT